MLARNILLTGASSGIGRATALALAGGQTRLFLVARRVERLQTLEEEVRALGGTAFSASLDLRRSEDVESMVRLAMEKLGRIDVLINNAAFGYYGTLENTPPEIVREIFALNFDAPLLASKLVTPIMRRQGGGHIINVSSVAGKRGLPLSGVYSATKFALNGISESLRLELREDNIRVSLIHPASTRSEFQKAIRIGDVTGDFKPLGRVQSSEEVARAIARCVRVPQVEIYPYWPSRLFAWANAIAPSLVDRIMVPYLRDRMSRRKHG